MDVTSLRFFPDVLKTIYCQLMPSSVAVAVRLSLRHVLVKFGDNQLLTRYDVISSMWSRNFFFQCKNLQDAPKLAKCLIVSFNSSSKK